MVMDRPSIARIYSSRTMVVLLALGLSGGIPNMLVNTIAPAWTTVAGWSVEAIGFLALFQLPYALKFLWAPLVDHLSIPLLAPLGRRRSWIVASQLAVIAVTVAIAIWGPGSWSEGESKHAWIFMSLLGLLVFMSATQDIVSDAYRVQVLRREELGAGAGMFVSGYRVAFVALGAGVLMAEKSIGWRMALLAMASLAIVGPVASLLAREPQTPPPTRATLHEVAVAPFSTLWDLWRLRIVALIAFVLLFRLPDQLANAMTAPLLLKGLGYTTEQLGWVRQAFGFALTILGALQGGWMVARWGIMRCLLVFGALQAVSNAGFYLLAQQMGASVGADPVGSPSIYALLPVIAIENFAGGLVTAGFVAYLMSVCRPSQVATQYALLTAVMALSGAIAGALSGVLTKRLDYPQFFLMSIAAGIPGLMLIWLVSPPAAPEGARHGERLGSPDHDT